MPRHRYPWLIGLCGLAGLVVGIALLVRLDKAENDPGGHPGTGNDRQAPALHPILPQDPETAAAAPPVAAPHPDEQWRSRIVGTWQDDYEGKRTMTLRADGTGTMVVELSGLKAAIVAPRLTFHMQWSVSEGRLRKRSLGGEPQVQVNMILKTFGDTATGRGTWIVSQVVVE